MNYLQEMASMNFIDKYAFTKEDGTKETWDESIDRIYDMHRLKLSTDDRIGFAKSLLMQELEEASKLEKKKVFLSAQRARQWAEPYEHRGVLAKNERLYNCAGSYCDRVNFFSQAMYLLLCGCGVGFNICYRHTDKLPSVKYVEPDEKPFVIPDTIEGWSDAVLALMTGYLVTGKRVEFDYSKIRQKGDLIAGKFIHSGYEPLKDALDKAEAVLAKAEGRKLKPIECYDIVCYLAEAVLSGGVRRSATICQFSWNDEEMMNAKTGSWWEENPQRAMSNISPLMVRKKVKKADVERVVNCVKQFGEPGVIFCENELTTLNPCAEVGMIPMTVDGKSGWQLCNLTEINCAATKTKEEFFEACYFASVMATIQASYDSFPYLGRTTEQIVRGAALIGVSLTGIMDSGIELTADVLKQGAKVVKDTNAHIASLLGIMPARRCTTVKPSGNASILLGTTSGIHPSHSNKYLRHIRLNKNGDMYKFIKANASCLIVNDDKPYDAIIAFPIKNDKAKTKADYSFDSFVDYVGFIYDNWVLAGDRGFENVTHNVSNTVVVREEEWGEVANKLFYMRSKIGGISLLMETSDAAYEYLPYCTVTDCSGVSEEVFNRCLNFIKENPTANFYEFANLFEEDAYDMKRCYAKIKYDLISETYNKIDWNMFNSKQLEAIGSMAATSCQGGACEI